MGRRGQRGPQAVRAGQANLEGQGKAQVLWMEWPRGKEEQEWKSALVSVLKMCSGSSGSGPGKSGLASLRWDCHFAGEIQVQRDRDPHGAERDFEPRPQAPSSEWCSSQERISGHESWTLPPELCRHGRVPRSLRFLPQGLAERIKTGGDNHSWVHGLRGLYLDCSFSPGSCSLCRGVKHSR